MDSSGVDSGVVCVSAGEVALLTVALEVVVSSGVDFGVAVSGVVVSGVAVSGVAVSGVDVSGVDVSGVVVSGVAVSVVTVSGSVVKAVLVSIEAGKVVFQPEMNPLVVDSCVIVISVFEKSGISIY
ncbi:unnamed protein product [Sphagnum balticum]